MKKVLLLLFIIFHCGVLSAATRTEAQAKRVAARLLDKPQRANLSSSLYIYNNENKEGFVIVSKSDRMRPVLGYCENGNLDESSMPDNMRSWIAWMDQASTYLEEHPEAALSKAQLAASATNIEPLLKNIAWGQDAPFNRNCPTVGGKTSVTGCVATAGAMCVYYHRYPTKGTGTYKSAGSPANSVVFSEQSYNYTLMFDKYTSSLASSTSRLNEVAKLSYHCGIMSDMRYSPNGSSTSAYNLRRGLVENFGYDPYCQMISRSCYSLEDWQEILRNELEQKRPIIFSGYSNDADAGHCFVVDGLNEEGLFHVNWGWEGEFNGYFDIVVLNPDGAGTGAIECSDGFSFEQQAMVQLAPAGKMTDAKYFCPISAPSGSFELKNSSISLGNPITVQINDVYNFHSDVTTGKFGVALYQNGKCVQYLLSEPAYDMPGSANNAFSGFGEIGYQVTLPKSLTQGTYQLYPCFVPTKGTFINKCGIIRVKATQANFYTCTISNGKASFSIASQKADVSISNWSIDKGNIPLNQECQISCQLQNKSTLTSLVGRYFLKLTSPSKKEQLVEATEVLTLSPGATGTLYFPISLSELGSWKSELYIFYQNIGESLEEMEAIANSAKNFTVSDQPTRLSSIQSEREEDVIYNLLGKPVNKNAALSPGIYFVNGKKIIIGR